MFVTTYHGHPDWTPASVGVVRGGAAGTPTTGPCADIVSATRDAADIADAAATFGDRLSDRVAAVGGSWGFILAFTLLLVGWMLLNSGVLPRLGHAFDPYPFIFLNLMLSTLAAIQGPVIMMSQNRQAAKDRLAARLDYEVNLRAELDILRLHDMIEHMVAARLDELLERRPAAS